MYRLFGIICGISLLMGARQAKGQTLAPGLESRELILIGQTYQRNGSLKFDVVYEYGDSASPAVLESLNANYEFRDGHMHAMIDSTEIIIGDKYCLTVYHDDRFVNVVSKPTNPDVLKLPLMDSLFRNSQISSYANSNLNDSTRRITLSFTPQSFYSGYIIDYDIRTYLIRKVQYFIKQPPSVESPGSGVTRIVLNFSNYNTAMLQDSDFDEYRFIEFKNGQIQLKSSYSDYQLLFNASN